MSGGSKRGRFGQEAIIFAIAVVVFGIFSALIPDFLSAGNIVSMVQSVSVLGILGLGMAITILGRGIDLSIVASMSVAIAWMLVQLNAGAPLAQALPLAIGFSVLVGIINGILVAYVEIPAIFATLAMGVTVYGFGKFFLVESDVNHVPESWRWLADRVAVRPLGLPVPVIAFLGCAVLAHFALRYLRDGRFIYAMGDNPVAARTTGVPVRLMMVLQYVISALIALLAGLLMTMLVTSMNTRIVSGTLVYDVILVVVLGGISLSGGRGGIFSVVVGTLLIGIMLNGMTMLNLTYTAQNVIKALILLLALVLDTLINPRDEQTAQQGDI